MMPGEDGLSLTKKLLNQYFTPIILLTARKETSDRIIGLETGADDYISKPFEPRELILRIESIFKRIKKFDQKKSIKDINIGILKFDSKRQELWNGDCLIPLTRAERLLINKLINSVNEPVPRRQLAQEIFNDFNKKVKVDLINSDTYKDIERERVVDVNINRLRKKIEKNPKSPRYLKTVRSIGYMLVPD
jgi:two-component system phosphate regulon response regulator OmpR